MAVFDITRVNLEGIERELKRFNNLIELFLKSQFGIALTKEGMEVSQDDDSSVSFTDEEADVVREEMERQDRQPKADV